MKYLKSVLLSLAITSSMTVANLIMGVSGPLPFPLYHDTGILDAILWYGVGVRQIKNAWDLSASPVVSFNLVTFLISWALLFLLFVGLSYLLKGRKRQ